MKIVIDIPRKTYEHIRSCGGHRIFNIQDDDNLTVTKAIFNGTVEARPQGGWIFDEYTRKEDKKYAPNGFYLCSVCCNKQFEKSNYCPNCGAKMTKEVENE